MPQRILSADEVKASITKHRAARAKENRDFKQRQLELEAYHDLRDNVVSIVRNSGVSFEDIHAQCGPHPNTLLAWTEKRVSQPRLGKIRATLRILGYDFAIVERGTPLLTKRAQ